jgi:hypothetical protein
MGNTRLHPCWIAPLIDMSVRLSWEPKGPQMCVRPNGRLRQRTGNLTCAIPLWYRSRSGPAPTRAATSSICRSLSGLGWIVFGAAEIFAGSARFPCARCGVSQLCDASPLLSDDVPIISNRPLRFSNRELRPIRPPEFDERAPDRSGGSLCTPCTYCRNYVLQVFPNLFGREVRATLSAPQTGLP